MSHFKIKQLSVGQRIRVTNLRGCYFQLVTSKAILVAYIYLLVTVEFLISN